MDISAHIFDRRKERNIMRDSKGRLNLLLNDILNVIIKQKSFLLQRGKYKNKKNYFYRLRIQQRRD